MAPTGAVVNHSGSCAKPECATMRASGLAPSASARPALMSTRLAAPSDIDEELAAVTVPSAANAGRSVGMRSGSMREGSSSVDTTVSPLRPVIVTGASSRSKAPSHAARARSSEASANAS